MFGLLKSKIVPICHPYVFHRIIAACMSERRQWRQIIRTNTDHSRFHGSFLLGTSEERKCAERTLHAAHSAKASKPFKLPLKRNYQNIVLNRTLYQYRNFCVRKCLLFGYEVLKLAFAFLSVFLKITRYYYQFLFSWKSFATWIPIKRQQNSFVMNSCFSLMKSCIVQQRTRRSRRCMRYSTVWRDRRSWSVAVAFHVTRAMCIAFEEWSVRLLQFMFRIFPRSSPRLTWQLLVALSDA